MSNKEVWQKHQEFLTKEMSDKEIEKAWKEAREEKKKKETSRKKELVR